LQSFASPDGIEWQRVGPVPGATRLSDDDGQALLFAGAFVGLRAQDSGGTRSVADFDYFGTRHQA
jgi:xylan 1,4-beta-xylosidase